MTSVQKEKVPRPQGKRTLAQKEACRVAWETLSKDVSEAQGNYADLAKKIAAKHQRSVPWARSQLYLGARKNGKQRKAIPWNGFVSRQMADANAIRVGPKWNLPAFVKQHKIALQAAYALLTQEELEMYRVEVEEMRAAKATMARHNPKAVQKDVDHTFEVFKREFFAVEQRTGCRAFYMCVQGDVEDHNVPKIYMDPDTVKFFKTVLNLDPKKLAMQYEAYIVGGSQGVVKVHKKTNTENISECRRLIAESLDMILKKHRIPTNVNNAAKLMNYVNYEKRVVELYGVELRGWPCAQFKNPGTLRHDELVLLLVELDTERCRWVKLSEEELHLRILSNARRQEMGEQVYTARKGGQGVTG